MVNDLCIAWRVTCPFLRAADELYQPDVRSIVDALNDVGMDERDVVAVINSHLHFDHCGQNHRLPNAEVWVTEAEVAAAAEEFYTVAEWAHIGPERRRFSGDGEVLADGIQILHTPGHQSVSGPALKRQADLERTLWHRVVRHRKGSGDLLDRVDVRQQRGHVNVAAGNQVQGRLERQ